MSSILYISTNRMWSGSEVLWTASAKRFMSEGYTISFACSFHHAELEQLQVPHLYFQNRYIFKSIFKRAIERFTPMRFASKDLLAIFIKQVHPALVVISQGNNVDSLSVMECCGEVGVPYVTLTQLVSEVHFLAIDSHTLPLYQQVYLKAKGNYFVSCHNKSLNNRMLGISLPNAELVYNPCKITGDVPAYPFVAEKYRVALVGRVECLHKGYDLLLEVLKQDKWRDRSIEFNVYGNGPHLELLKTTKKHFDIANINFCGYANDVREVWEQNHLLCMPSRMEGQALTLIEAMNCGRGAVVTNAGGAAELIEDGVNGFLAPAPTVAFLDAALEKAWQNRDNWEVMGIHALDKIRALYPKDVVGFFNQKILKQIE